MTNLTFNWINSDITDYGEITVREYKKLDKLNSHGYPIEYQVHNDCYKIEMILPGELWPCKSITFEYLPKEKELYLEYQSFEVIKGWARIWIDNPLRTLLEYQANLSSTTKLSFQAALDLIRLIEKVARDVKNFPDNIAIDNIAHSRYTE